MFCFNFDAKSNFATCKKIATTFFQVYYGTEYFLKQWTFSTKDKLIDPYLISNYEADIGAVI